MPRLIHLNRPSRVGKSTLARRYADEHPSTLVLDLDVLAGLIGGWRDDFSGVLVDRIRGHLAEYLIGRPHAILIDTTGLTESATYLRLRAAIDDSGTLPRPR